MKSFALLLEPMWRRFHQSFETFGLCSPVPTCSGPFSKATIRVAPWGEIGYTEGAGYDRKVLCVGFPGQVQMEEGFSTCVCKL